MQYIPGFGPQGSVKAMCTCSPCSIVESVQMGDSQCSAINSIQIEKSEITMQIMLGLFGGGLRAMSVQAREGYNSTNLSSHGFLKRLCVLQVSRITAAENQRPGLRVWRVKQTKIGRNEKAIRNCVQAVPRKQHWILQKKQNG